MEKVLKRFTVLRERLNGVDRGIMLLFAPAALFMVLSLITLVAPGFTVLLVSSVLMFIGLMSAVAAWKLAQIRRSMKDIIRQFEGNVVVHLIHPSGAGSDTDMVYEDRKFTIH